MPSPVAAPRPWIASALIAALGASIAPAADAPSRPMDFNREIRPILFGARISCHGPDAAARKGLMVPLRLDTEAGALADLGGYAAIVKGHPEDSELIRRVTSDDANEVMPPKKLGKPLSPEEVERLTEWVRQGAPYAQHWAYQTPKRPAPPEVRNAAWSKTRIDRFLLARLEREGLSPSPEADRETLLRRVSLDLTGLPPSPEEVAAFRDDPAPDAYEKLVDRLLARPSYGEHWGRLWLDLARYADSAGYADDPARTIWAYRDYVVRSFNANKPFDRFTIEQIAGDLLPEPTDEQLVATAFHRNTPTNNEGGTIDEEFRNVAVVDRVNTTMSVWMGSFTVACAQCHDHKYDPFSQEEYFRLFAFFNNTQDADRPDESPVLALESDETKARRAEIGREMAGLEETLFRTPTPELTAGQAGWEASFSADLPWEPLDPSAMQAQSGASLARQEDRSILAPLGGKTDTFTIHAPLAVPKLAALRLEALPDASLPGQGPGHASGNFVISRVKAEIRPPGAAHPSARFVRIEMPGTKRILSLAEVQAFRAGENVARNGEARQSSTAFEGPAFLAIDGNTNGHYADGKSTTHTWDTDNPWWELDLKAAGPIDRLAIWNRTDNGLHARLTDFRIVLLDEERRPVWSREVKTPPNPSTEFAVDRAQEVDFAAAVADYAQPQFEASSVLRNPDPASRGWAVGGQTGKPHTLTLVARAPLEVEAGSAITVTIEQVSKHENHTLGRFRLATTGDDRAGAYSSTPAAILAILKTPPEARTEAQSTELTRHYLAEVAPELAGTRTRLAGLRAEIAAMKPMTTVPILRERPSDQKRATRIQLRGSYTSLGDAVTEGVPAVFPPLPSDAPADRLALARWLVDPENPLTARVVANRTWEEVFGIGLVATSEDFGSQGEPPSHPELLDWLATELVGRGWDLKALLRQIVTSAAYRQESRVSPEMSRLDPDNRLLARGPRVRLPAETIRDQALAVSGLLSPKLFGPPVKPPQPASGLAAAFGSGIDWETSRGEDRYRRGLYTSWRRSNPYPSMATFDAPNREVCTVRRSRTNTPLQALVTLNDPVYVEAAQALARRMLATGGASPAEKAALGFRLTLVREPSAPERDRLAALYEDALARFRLEPQEAIKLATDPIGPLPEGADAAELASWTVVANVLLNLDETLMKP